MSASQRKRKNRELCIISIDRIDSISSFKLIVRRLMLCLQKNGSFTVLKSLLYLQRSPNYEIRLRDSKRKDR